MKDNQAPPFLGQSPKDYDPVFIDRAFRNLERYLKLMGSTGPIRVDAINIANIPTSSVGLRSGDLWSNAGVITIVP
jgi:hypothetical protein